MNIVAPINIVLSKCVILATTNKSRIHHGWHDFYCSFCWLICMNQQSRYLLPEFPWCKSFSPALGNILSKPWYNNKIIHGHLASTAWTICLNLATTNQTTHTQCSNKPKNYPRKFCNNHRIIQDTYILQQQRNFFCKYGNNKSDRKPKSGNTINNNNQRMYPGTKKQRIICNYKSCSFNNRNNRDLWIWQQQWGQHLHILL